MIRNLLRKLTRDRRGAAGIAPVFVIISVIIAATTAASLVTATTVAARASAELDMEAATRSAIRMMVSETKNVNMIAIATAISAPGYTPTTGPGEIDGGAKVRYTGFSQTQADAWTVRFTVESPNPLVDDVRLAVEYKLTPMDWDGAGWVDAAVPASPDDTLWVPIRVVKE